MRGGCTGGVVRRGSGAGWGRGGPGRLRPGCWTGGWRERALGGVVQRGLGKRQQPGCLGGEPAPLGLRHEGST